MAGKFEGDTDPTPVVGPVDTVRERRSRRPWLVVAGSAVAVAAALAGGLVLVNRAEGPAYVSTLAASTASVTSPPTSVATSSAAPSSSAADGVPATPATIVYRLQQLLPAGRTSGFARVSDGSLFAQLYLDQGHGPGMLRMSIFRSSRGPNCLAGQSCQRLPNGDIVDISRLPANCIQSLIVEVYRPNGFGVQLNVSTCLQWNGSTNPAGGPALTQDQAVTIAEDPSWGLTMSSALVTAAQQKFPNLPLFS